MIAGFLYLQNFLWWIWMDLEVSPCLEMPMCEDVPSMLECNMVFPDHDSR